MSEDVVRQERRYLVSDCDECGQSFEQFRVTHVYCSKRCAVAAGMKRRSRDEYRASEEARENMRQGQARRHRVVDR